MNVNFSVPLGYNTNNLLLITNNYIINYLYINEVFLQLQSTVIHDSTLVLIERHLIYAYPQNNTFYSIHAVNFCFATTFFKLKVERFIGIIRIIDYYYGL